jgi:ArsR family transcriptional regulator
MKQLLYEKQAEVARAIAHPIRMAILDFLRSGPQCVCDIAEAVRAERSNVSRHLSLMVTAGVLTSEKQGLKVIYSLRTPCVLRFVDCLGECLKEKAVHDQRLLSLLS